MKVPTLILKEHKPAIAAAPEQIRPQNPNTTHWRQCEPR